MGSYLYLLLWPFPRLLRMSRATRIESKSRVQTLEIKSEDTTPYGSSTLHLRQSIRRNASPCINLSWSDPDNPQALDACGRAFGFPLEIGGWRFNVALRFSCGRIALGFARQSIPFRAYSYFPFLPMQNICLSPRRNSRSPWMAGVQTEGSPRAQSPRGRKASAAAKIRVTPFRSVT